MTELLRTVRKQRGLTLAALAEQTGLTKSYLSKIERGHSIPSIAASMKVAHALNVDVAQLFSERSDQEKVSVDRALDRGADRGRYVALAAGQLGKSMSPFLVCPAGRAARAGHPLPAVHGGQEFVFVHTGTVALTYGDHTLTLAAGDSAYFDASVSHALRTIGDAPAEVVVVATNQPERSPR